MARPMPPGTSIWPAIAQSEIEPSGDIHATVEFKRHLAKVLTIRALTTVKEGGVA